MNKKFEKFLNDKNVELKRRGFFKNHEITIDGDFTNEYNFINLSRNSHHFPIATASTECEAISVVNAYMTGLAHGRGNSYVKMCDND